MSTWSGWQADFLSAASLPNTAKNRQFLSDWAANANHPECANNPIDLTHHEPGSANCAATGQTGVNIQRYAAANGVSAHSWARTAFASEIDSGDYPALHGAFESGDPYTVKDTGKVGTDLGNWSSTNFATAYLDTIAAGGPTGAENPHLHKGWASIRHSFNVNLADSLKTSTKQRRRALRALSRASKVKL